MPAADGTEGQRCAARCKPRPLPPSLTIEKASTHPLYRYSLEPGAQCDLADAHDGPHRAGGLIWHEPPLIVVAGKPYVAPAAPWRLLGELVT